MGLGVFWTFTSIEFLNFHHE